MKDQFDAAAENGFLTKVWSGRPSGAVFDDDNIDNNPLRLLTAQVLAAESLLTHLCIILVNFKTFPPCVQILLLVRASPVAFRTNAGDCLECCLSVVALL